MNSSIFREYDIRGLVPQDLNHDTVTRIGKAFGTLLRGKKLTKVAVGGDVRLHTDEIKGWLIDALNATGIDVWDLGQIPTPVAYFSAFHLPIDGFAMVTASHNPKEYNGFKLGIGKTTLFGSEIQEVRELAEKGEFETGKGISQSKSISEDYCRMIEGHFQFKRKLKVVVDPANATGALFTSKLYARMGADVTGINDNVDGNFPSHHPDPTVLENMKQLSKEVVEQGADVGLGLDGDSDRLGVIDDKGRLIPGDILTLVYAQQILKKSPGRKIVFEVKSSMALEEGIREAGGTPIMWKVGHSLLKAKMQEENAPLAGEVSGHLFFADSYYGFDDAIYAGCRLLEILDETGQKLSEIIDAIPQYPNTPEMRLEAADDNEKFSITQKAVEYFSNTQQVLAIDGVRILFPDGWALVRASNTQPMLVTRFEGKTPEARDRIMNEVLTKLKEFGTLKESSGH